MQEYSILFLDIDGTVLDTQNRISANLKQLFKRPGKGPISFRDFFAKIPKEEVRRILQGGTGL